MIPPRISTFDLSMEPITRSINKLNIYDKTRQRIFEEIVDFANKHLEIALKEYQELLEKEKGNT